MISPQEEPPIAAAPEDSPTFDLGRAADGQRLVASRYLIGPILGRGGFGAVYAARDTFLDRPVAIKILPHATDSLDARDRFLREARATARLRHPNVVTLHDAGEDSRGFYLVLELCEGAPLQRALADGPMPLTRAAAVGRGIALALAAAHALGIVHRDIKPANVLLAEDGTVKVMDFGIARLAGEARLTADGSLSGTPSYMAPEQIEGTDSGPGVDLFALGIVLHEMLAGHPPFRGQTHAEVIGRILAGKRDPLPDAVREATPAIAALIDGLLRRDPSERPSPKRVAEVLAELDGRAVGPSPGSDGQQDPCGSKGTGASLLVLPFVNLSPEADSEYVCDGLADELITDLSSVRTLRVISRTSAAKLKGTDKDLPTLARELRVRHVLEGSVKKWGQELRISGRLIDGRTEEHLWSQKLKGTMDDLFDIEEAIARAVLKALGLRPSEGEERRLCCRPIPNVQAFEHYLRSRQLVLAFRAEPLQKARDYLERGLKVMGDNATLLSALSYVHWQHCNAGVSTDPAHIERAQDCAERALALDPSSASAVRMLGLVAFARRAEVASVMGYLKKALDLDPNDTDALFWFSLFASLVGRTSFARPCAERLLALDPLTAMHYSVAALAAQMEGDAEGALGPMEKAHAMEPENPIMSMVYGQMLAMAGRREQAYDRFEHLARTGAGTLFHGLAEILRLGLEGARDGIDSLLSPDTRDACRLDVQYSWIVAQAYALSGAPDEALDWLRNAVEWGFINYPFLAHQDPFLAPLRTDPRFLELMKDVRRRWESFEIREP